MQRITHNLVHLLDSVDKPKQLLHIYLTQQVLELTNIHLWLLSVHSGTHTYCSVVTGGYCAAFMLQEKVSQLRPLLLSVTQM